MGAEQWVMFATTDAAAAFVAVPKKKPVCRYCYC
jgi:hypothetical protein